MAKIEGKTVFVPQLLPGEKADIEITESHKDYDRGSIVKLIEKSEHRRNPPCPYYGICGGCNLQIADDLYQKELRLGILQDCFRRALRLNEKSPETDVVYNAEVISGKDWGYRNRFQFHAGGLKKRAQESIIALEDCPVAVPEVRELLIKKKLPASFGRLHVFNGEISDDDAIDSDSVKGLKKGVIRDFCSDGIQETYVEICGEKIYFDIRGFFQSNIDALEKAVKSIKPIVDSYADQAKRAGGELLDMYSGVGTLSALLGRAFKKTTLVEHNKKALRFADKNLRFLPHDVFAMTGENWVRTQAARKKYDAVIIDPPRSGIEKPVMSWLCQPRAELRPLVIFSVSCDPVTHARDAASLIASGYELKTLKLLDFYPQTSHIESFALFECKIRDLNKK